MKAYETFGNERAVQFVAMATPEDLRANAEYIRMADEVVDVPGGNNSNNYANGGENFLSLARTVFAFFPALGASFFVSLAVFGDVRLLKLHRFSRSCSTIVPALFDVRARLSLARKIANLPAVSHVECYVFMGAVPPNDSTRRHF